MVTTTMKALAKVALGWIAAAVGIAAAVPAAASTITYYHNDIAGSPVAATNSAGQVIWRESYRPYGERLTKSASAKSNDVWFTSRREDSSGLVYMGARHYDPVAGRFVSTDPKGFDQANVQSFNRYAYANNNPLRFSDPDGAQALPMPVSPPPLVRPSDLTAQPPGLVGQSPTTAVPGFVSPSLVELVIFGGAPEVVRGLLNVFNERSDDTLRPGPHAGDSIPARGPERDFTPDERERVNEIGNSSGCHTCGASQPGTLSGNWVLDHQPVSALNSGGEAQRLYPQCLQCSKRQGGQARAAKAREDAGE